MDRVISQAIINMPNLHSIGQTAPEESGWSLAIATRRRDIDTTLAVINVRLCVLMCLPTAGAVQGQGDKIFNNGPNVNIFH